MIENDLITPFQTAKILHIDTNTLAVWRCMNRYPLKYIKIGRKVFYRLSDIDQFINLRTRGAELCEK